MGPRGSLSTPTLFVCPDLPNRSQPFPDSFTPVSSTVSVHPSPSVTDLGPEGEGKGWRQGQASTSCELGSGSEGRGVGTGVDRKSGEWAGGWKEETGGQSKDVV